ncbi:MAG: MATE family efflux transporter, partial [Bacteroidaceae bacterium]|nr:MATE family efflux transporter [Bacteroidaceae bacterium]
MSNTNRTSELLLLVREGKALTFRQQILLAIELSLPAIVAQLSAIVMQYIDASMVGSLGSDPSASIGLVATTTWLFSGLCSAFVSGFSVQVAHSIGANKFEKARII